MIVVHHDRLPVPNDLVRVAVAFVEIGIGEFFAILAKASVYAEAIKRVAE